MSSIKQKIVLLLVFTCFLSSINTAPLTASQLAQNLGKGFDVTWSEFTKYMKAYTSIIPKHFSKAGFKNVRIRTDEFAPNVTFMTNLTQQVNDCLANNIYPIIAYQGRIIEDTTMS
jgi:hypothetical protein